MAGRSGSPTLRHWSWTGILDFVLSEGALDQTGYPATIVDMKLAFVGLTLPWVTLLRRRNFKTLAQMPTRQGRLRSGAHTSLLNDQFKLLLQVPTSTRRLISCSRTGCRFRVCFRASLQGNANSANSTRVRDQVPGAGSTGLVWGTSLASIKLVATLIFGMREGRKREKIFGMGFGISLYRAAVFCD